jgi:hypothetical protein
MWVVNGHQAHVKYTDNSPAPILPLVSLRSLQGYILRLCWPRRMYHRWWRTPDARKIDLVAYDQRRDKSRVRSSGYGGGREYYMTGSRSLSEIVLIPVKTSEFSLHSNAAI